MAVSTGKHVSGQSKIAIVHDWLVGGGAEQVVLELHRMFPDAPIYTSYCNDEWRAKLDGKVVTGYLQHWPFSALRKFLPVLRIKWFESLDLSAFDLVISSSGNGEAKGVKAGSRFRAGQSHVCYCHSPTHFYWRHYDDYLARPGFSMFDPLVRLALRALIGPLRRWDLVAAGRPDYFIANSSHIQADIKRFYNRDAVVIHPPVNTSRFQLAEAATGASVTDRQGFVTVGRQQPYKRTDLIVEACTALDLPLTVIGRGPEHTRLRRLAGPTISFITGAAATDQVIVDSVQQAKAFIFAAHEDFGITPIEAMAAGTPVIAYRAGGALDYVQPGETGAFFDEQTADSLIDCLRTFDSKAYDPHLISQTAETYAAVRFQTQITAILDKIAKT